MRPIFTASIVACLLGLIPTAGFADVIVGGNGAFTETGPGLIFDSSGVGDLFTFTNTSDPGVRITSLTVSLGALLNFDLGGGFLSTGGFGAPVVIAVDGGTGASIVGGDVLFSDFDPGETVSITVDVDGLILQVIPGSLFSLGSTLTAVFDGPGFTTPVSLTGPYTAPNLLGPVANVGVSALVPEPAAATLLIAGGMALLARRRRAAAGVGR